jgi:4-hydroxy-3-methylbut-2-en-1-yl diphosphate reductase
LIDAVHELQPKWLAGVGKVLITAGASAPEDVVQECVAYLERHYDATVESRTIREEHVNFPLPKELRSLTVV